jgi:protein subunit release factor B
MYMRFAERKGWKYEVMDAEPRFGVRKGMRVRKPRNG